MPNNKNLKSPPPTKKAKTDDDKVEVKMEGVTAAEGKQLEEDGEVPVEDEFFDFEITGCARAASAKAKQGGGFKKLVDESVLADSGQKKQPSKVMMKVFVVRGVGVCFGMDKGKRPDVYPEKYLKDIVVGNVQIMGAEDFLKENAVLREVSRPEGDMLGHDRCRLTALFVSASHVGRRVLIAMTRELKWCTQGKTVICILVAFSFRQFRRILIKTRMILLIWRNSGQI